VKKSTLPLVILVSAVLSACGSNDTPANYANQPSPSQTDAATPNQGFSVAKIEAELDRMGVTDPNLRKHMIGVAIYYAHEAGQTTIEPTVKPLEPDGVLTGQAVNRTVSSTIGPYTAIPSPASVAYWQYNTNAQAVINMYGSAYYSGFCTPTATDNDMVQIFYGTAFRDRVYAGATVYGKRAGSVAYYYAGQGIRVFNDGYTHLCKGTRYAELSALYTTP